MTTWPMKKPNWTYECIKLLKVANVNTKSKQNVKNFIDKSRNFPLKFPVVANTTQMLLKTIDEQILERNIKSAYPIIHEYALNLCAQFILYKRTHGSSEIERNFYNNFSVLDLIQRLLQKRAVSFMCPCDQYLLLDGTKGLENWNTIGKNVEKTPLTLTNCLSYDEIKLSALLSVSSYSCFINNGSRTNDGVVEETSNLEPEAIVIGLIGTRLERENAMEYQEIIISEKQNVPENGYGPNGENFMLKFYELESVVYKDVGMLCKNNVERFIKLNDGLYFDNEAYVRRLVLSIDTLLLEANYRAKERNKNAYIHVVGLGLGVWKISSHQTKVFVDTFAKRLRFFGSKLSNISDLHFAYISNLSTCAGCKNGDRFPIETHPLGGIKIHISKREPFQKLDAEKLLVVSYAWDGNALPGNEYWLGMLSATGDSATAAASQIAELHNPHINDAVDASNLMIATIDGEVIPFRNYVEYFVNN